MARTVTILPLTATRAFTTAFSMSVFASFSSCCAWFIFPLMISCVLGGSWLLLMVRAYFLVRATFCIISK